MKLLLFSTLALLTLEASSKPIMGPPERRIYITSVGDVLEWQPGLGIVVLSKAQIRTTTRRVRSSDGKSIIPLETRRETVIPLDRRREPPAPIDPTRPRLRPETEGKALMEEMERVN